MPSEKKNGLLLAKITIVSSLKFGGREGIRTPDPLLAKKAVKIK